MMNSLQFHMVKLAILLATIPLCISGCGKKESYHRHADHSQVQATHSHHHEPPHGGTVIRLGDELFHMEWVEDTEAGIMRCYIMDGHLEQFTRIKQESFDVLVKTMDGQEISWTFQSVENRATGETVGNTSEFHAQLSALPNQNTFEGTIQTVHILGQQFENITFKYPEGNETH